MRSALCFHRTVLPCRIKQANWVRVTRALLEKPRASSEHVTPECGSDKERGTAVGRTGESWRRGSSCCLHARQVGRGRGRGSGAFQELCKWHEASSRAGGCSLLPPSNIPHACPGHPPRAGHHPRCWEFCEDHAVPPN